MARYCFILRALRETGWRNYSLPARLEDAP
jgi:hypothetical protein